MTNQVQVFENKKLKRKLENYRGALLYVKNTKTSSYHDADNMLEDIKVVVNAALEGDDD